MAVSRRLATLASALMVGGQTVSDSGNTTLSSPNAVVINGQIQALRQAPPAMSRFVVVRATFCEETEPGRGCIVVTREATRPL